MLLASRDASEAAMGERGAEGVPCPPLSPSGLFGFPLCWGGSVCTHRDPLPQSGLGGDKG